MGEITSSFMILSSYRTYCSFFGHNKNTSLRVKIDISMFSVCCIIEGREEVLEKIGQCVDYVGLNCFYCNRCWFCHVTKVLQQQASKKGIKTFNSDIVWWSIDWYKGKKR